MDMKEFSSIIDNNKELFHEYLKENLLNKDQAPEVTGQTQGVFDGAVKNKTVKPFFMIEKNGRETFKLFLKSELEEYGKTRRILK